MGAVSNSQGPLRLAINGYGRIGRSVLRALVERSGDAPLQIVAINELADCDTIAHLTKYDSTHGRLPLDVSAQADTLAVGANRIALSHEPEVANLPWSEHAIDLVLECTGSFSDRSTAEKHLQAGAQRVLFSQPAESDVDATVVFGINEELLAPEHRILSNASCTTNCIVPVIDTLNRAFGIDSGAITTIHSAMNDQPVIDAYHHTDLRKTRAASQSVIPVDTALARGIERILPDMAGRFTARAMRVPTTNVSAIDLTVLVSKPTDKFEVNRVLQEATQGYRGVLAYTEELLASCDFNHDSHSGIVDAGQTQVANGKLVKVLVWFDNEWAFANRMLDTALTVHAMTRC